MRDLYWGIAGCLERVVNSERERKQGYLGVSGAFSDVVVVFFRSKQIETDFMVDSFVFHSSGFVAAFHVLFCGEFVFKKQQK